MVHIWYPADASPGTQRAEYYPYWSTVKRGMGERPLRGYGAAFSAIDSGQLRAHAMEKVTISKSSARYPVIVFSHGLGTPTFNYTIQLEHLASNGYVVVAIDHTYDTQIVVFPDGHAIPIAQEWERLSSAGDVNALKAFQAQRNEIGASDIRFVLDQLVEHNNAADGTTPFAGRLDLQRIGVFGHSLGGMTIGRACQLDSRIRACIDQDGLVGVPFFKDSRGKTMNQPFLLILHKQDPSDAQLAQMKMTRAEFENAYQQSLKEVHGALTTAQSEAYLLILPTPGNVHESFSDMPLLRSGGQGTAAIQSLETLTMIASVTFEFFEKTLNEKKDTVFDRPDPKLPIEIIHSNLPNSAR